MAEPAPTDRPRRSPVYRELGAAGARFEMAANAVFAVGFSDDPAQESAWLHDLGLCDLTLVKRAGYKGWASIQWARNHGVAVGDENNRAYPQSDGATVARLADSEILILGDLAGREQTIARLAGTEAVPGAYPVPRADTNCWFTLTGAQAATMLAKLCGVDLRPSRFANGTIAQTSVARLNAIVVRADRGDVLAYDLLTDFASASYMWGCLTDAMGEFGGRPIGVAALLAAEERSK